MIGLDGLEWEALNNFFAEGYLPNLKNLVETGAAGVLKTDFGDSPVTWTSIATGVHCEKHGICPQKEGSPNPFTYTYKHIRYPRMWEVLKKYNFQSRIASYFFYDYYKNYSTKVADNSENSFIHPVVEKNISRFGRTHDLSIDGQPHYYYGDLNNQFKSFGEKVAYLERSSSDLDVIHFQETDEICHKERGFYKRFF